jgi:hypothetical protein
VTIKTSAGTVESFNMKHSCLVCLEIAIPQTRRLETARKLVLVIQSCKQKLDGRSARTARNGCGVTVMLEALAG